MALLLDARGQEAHRGNRGHGRSRPNDWRITSARLDDMFLPRAEAAYYGHRILGCLHIRPIIDLKQEPEVEKLRSIAEQVSDLVLEFGAP